MEIIDEAIWYEGATRKTEKAMKFEVSRRRRRPGNYHGKRSFK